jgi:CysZ protein
VKQVMKDLVPALLSELRKMSYFLLRAIPLLILFIIPGVNLVAPFLWIAFSAWFLALEYGDYPMANHGLAFRPNIAASSRPGSPPWSSAAA